MSLIKSESIIHTLLPLSPKGEVCDINGVCVDAAEDEMFRLTTKEGRLTIEREMNPDAGFLPRLDLRVGPRSDSGCPVAALSQQPDSACTPGVTRQRAREQDEFHEQRQ
jgi:hypothetical protein